MNRRTPFGWLLGVGLLFGGLAACGLGGGGGVVPTLTSDFDVGATIPGWLLRTPGHGRGDVLALARHDGQGWDVVLSRPMARRPKDFRFALAVHDNGTSHVGVPNIAVTSDPSAIPSPQLIVARRVPNGSIVPDGTLSGGEWPAPLDVIPTAPQNDLPEGRYPTTTAGAVSMSAAYDDAFYYFVVRWSDASLTESNLGPLLQWDGSAWRARPHGANDVDKNGLLEPPESMIFGATAEDEDRLSFFFPIHDAEEAFRPGAPGCAASCHTNTLIESAGFEALHSTALAGDLVDVWEWRSAATNPGRRARDRVLGHGAPAAGLSGGGSGFAEDQGRAPYFRQDVTLPSAMYAAAPSGLVPLIAEQLEFALGTPQGYPVLPLVMATARAYDPLDFNGTGMGPVPWTGVPPFFGNDFLTPFVQQDPEGSQRDVEARGSFVNGVWTVELRRRRVTSGSNGPFEDDIQFENDADFASGLTALLGEALPFSISLTDRASGSGTRETRFPGPLFLTSAAPAAATSSEILYLHDYGPGFSPTMGADFFEPRETLPLSTFGPPRDLRLKAGTDGGENLLVSVRWNDPTPDAGKDRWRWTGFAWEAAGDQDELRVLWNLDMPRREFVSGGCAVFCHGNEFRATALAASADLWHWQAGRTAPLDVCDDLSVDGRLPLGAQGPLKSALHGDALRAPYEPNFQAGRTFPVFMSPRDPNANAAFLVQGVAGIPDAVAFQDALGNLPPPPPGGGLGTVSFTDDVLPIFAAHCSACHPPFAGLDLSSHASVLSGSSNGPVVFPGNPGQSVLIGRITGQLTPQMPLGGSPLMPVQIQVISTWISEGALNN